MTLSNLIKSIILAAAFLMSTSCWAVDINTASADQLAEELQGIGLSKAQAIVDYRQKNGKFKIVNELLLVKGIGEKTLARNLDVITLSDTGDKTQ